MIFFSFTRRGFGRGEGGEGMQGKWEESCRFLTGAINRCSYEITF